MGGLSDHADFVGAVVKDLQLLVGGEVQVAQTANGPLNHHELPALPAQHQKGDEDDGRGHDRAQGAHNQAHLHDGTVNLRGVVPHHEDPAPVLQVLVDHQLVVPVFVPVGVCTDLDGAVRLDAADDLLVSGVGGLGVQQRAVLVIEVHAGVGIQEYIFAVRQTLDAQIEQRVYQMAGVNSGTHVADAPLSLKDGVVHGQDHAAGAGRLHDAQVGQLRLGQDGVLKALQGIPGTGGHADGTLGGVSEDVGVRGCDVQPFKDALDGGKVFGVFLGLTQQRRVAGVLQKVVNFAAQGKSGHIFLCGNHIVVDNCGSGFHSVRHLVGNVTFDCGRRVGGYDDPEKQHPNQGDGGCDDSDPCGQFLVCKEFHKLSSIEKSFGDMHPRLSGSFPTVGTAPCKTREPQCPAII